MRTIKQVDKFIKNLESKAKKDKIQRFLVGGVVFSMGKILIVRRSFKDDFLPGYFEIPGGRIEEDENIIQGLEREIEEETNLKIKGQLKYIGYFDVVSPDGKKARQFNFLVQTISNKVKLSDEHYSHHWFGIDNYKDIFSLQIIIPIKKLLEKVISQIEKDPSVAI